MRISHQTIICGITAILLSSGLGCSHNDSFADDAPATASVPFDSATSSIYTAADPSAAIEAYGRAIAGAQDKLAVETAYVQRMISFGLPEMATSQARDLVAKSPNNGQAWAVLAYANAKKGDTPAAVEQLLSAADRSPDDSFVQRTAGQVVAFCDTQANKSTFPAETQRALETLRQKIGNREAFASAYQQTRNDLSAGPTTNQSQAAAPTTTVPSTDQASVPLQPEPAQPYVTQPYVAQPYVAAPAVPLYPYPSDYYDQSYYYGQPTGYYYRSNWWYPSAYRAPYYGSRIYLYSGAGYRHHAGDWRSPGRDRDREHNPVPLVPENRLTPMNDGRYGLRPDDFARTRDNVPYIGPRQIRSEPVASPSRDVSPQRVREARPAPAPTPSRAPSPPPVRIHDPGADRFRPQGPVRVAPPAGPSRPAASSPPPRSGSGGSRSSGGKSSGSGGGGKRR